MIGKYGKRLISDFIGLDRRFSIRFTQQCSKVAIKIME